MRSAPVLLVLLVPLTAGLRAQYNKPPDAAPAAEQLTMEQAAAEALDRNLDLAAEKLNVPIAEARQIAARLRPNPVATFSGQALDLLGAGFNPDSPAGPNQFTAHTDFVLERPGKRANRMAVAALDTSLAGLGVREMARQVIFAAQNAFVDVQQAKDSLELARSNLASVEAIVKINEAKVRSGDLAPVELERSRVAALQYRTAVEQAGLAVEQAKTRLQLLLGRKQTQPGFDVAGALRRDRLLETEEALKSRALSQRPDVERARQWQARSRADLRLQVANGKVDFTAGTEFTRQWAWGLAGNSVGFSFSVPLPVFNRNQGEIARSEREARQAAAREEALEASIAAEVEMAYRQYATSLRLLENIETNMLSRARSVRETTEYSYKRGEASLVEYLDAQRAYNDAVQSYNEARANHARSLCLIESVTGAQVAAASPGGRVSP